MIEIKKPWDGLKNQRISTESGATWSIAELIHETKDLEVMDIPIDHLCIAKNIGGMSIRKFASHMKVVLESDLQYPIILDDEGCIFDGCHRVVKALIEGKDTIKAVRFENDPEPIIKE